MDGHHANHVARLPGVGLAFVGRFFVRPAPRRRQFIEKAHQAGKTRPSPAQGRTINASRLDSTFGAAAADTLAA